MPITLSNKGARRLLDGHPWIFRSDILRTDPAPKPGEAVRVLDEKGAFLCVGFYNPHSQITVRCLSRQDIEITNDLLYQRIRAAWQHRLRFADPQSCRVIYAEADFLPGLIVDRFSDTLSLQCLCLGMEKRLPFIAQSLLEITGARGVYERDDLAQRNVEGLKQRKGWLAGEAEALVEMTENGIRMLVDVENGQKTGYFLDQKENRAALAPYVKGGRVLDCFCNVGGFSLHAAKFGARETLGVDVSQAACDAAAANARLNGFGQCEFLCDNAFDALRRMAHKGEAFDTVVLDPPAFTKSGSTVAGATRGYKDINLWGIRLVKEGGFLVTCSCSQHMTPELFSKTILSAAHDTGASLRLMEERKQAADHPILASMPESHYLKCNIYQVFHGV